MIAADNSTGSSVVLLIVGLFGSGTLAALARMIFTRAKTEAEAEAIRIGTLDQIVQTLSGRVDNLTVEVAYLRGSLDRTEQERDWWKERTRQLEEHMRLMKLPIPHPTEPLPTNPQLTIRSRRQGEPDDR